MTYNHLISPIYYWVENKANDKYYPFYLSFFLTLCCWFFAYNNIHNLDLNSASWEIVTLKSNDITNSLNHIDPYSWLAKKVFRLTIPVIMKICHLSPAGVLVLQFIVGFFLFVYNYKLSYKIIKDSVSATFITGGLSFLYFGRAAFYDINHTWFDGFSYFFIIIALYSNSIYIIFTSSFLAAWTDERAFVSLSIVLLFHQLKKEKFNHKLHFKHLIKLNRQSISVLSAIVLYITIRQILSFYFNMHTPSEGANYTVLKKTLPLMPIGIWTFLEGFWLLYLLSFTYTFKSKNYLLSIVFLMLIAVFTIISSCVTDITRSGSFLVPIIFILIIHLQNYQSINRFRLVLSICFITSFIFPATIICADWAIFESFQPPFFVKLGVYIVNSLINQISENIFVVNNLYFTKN